MIYQTEEQRTNSMCESSDDCVEEKFVRETCSIVVDAIGVYWTDKPMVNNLLHNAISDKLNNHYKVFGLLQQYEAHILDRVSRDLIKTFGLTSKVNHNYATHAKFSDIVNELEKKFNPPKTE